MDVIVLLYYCTVLNVDFNKISTANRAGMARDCIYCTGQHNFICVMTRCACNTVCRYHMMSRCWALEPQDRPCFSKLVVFMENELAEMEEKVTNNLTIQEALCCPKFLFKYSINFTCKKHSYMEMQNRLRQLR